MWLGDRIIRYKHVHTSFVIPAEQHAVVQREVHVLESLDEIGEEETAFVAEKLYFDARHAVLLVVDVVLENDVTSLDYEI